jgi:hypothetical protein
MHPRLDALLDPEKMLILDRAAFRAEHERYLFISSVQWGACLVELGLALWAWRAADTKSLISS